MDLIAEPACSLVARLRGGDLSSLDLLDAVEARVAMVDGVVNALPTLCFERARDHARALEAKPVAERGVLCGLPVAIKDLSDVAGVRSTHGSPVFAKAVPEKSAHVVERVEASGGIIYAKSNTPEFGAGANTFNEVFGATLNPWDTRLSAAGSSGGSAVALATGMAWMAHGSDMGGSLRNPASFNGIVGLRPSPGRVPAGPSANPYATLGVEGPMARNVDDLALFLDALCGFDAREPLSLEAPSMSFAQTAARREKPLRIAFSADLGITPVDAEIAEICQRAALQFEALGIPVESAHPDLSEAHDVFQTLRAHNFAVSLSDLFHEHRDLLKPEVVWNIEKGMALTSADLGRAEKARGVMVQRAAAFFEGYDLLLTPATIVPPYPVEQRYVTECAGHEFETYIDWLGIAYAITNISLPALSLPCGFTANGLPVGLQMVGKPRGEAALLAAAGILEDTFALTHLPINPRDKAQALS